MKTIAALRTFLVFFVGGIILGVAVGTLVLGFQVLRAGCLAAIPGAACGDAVLVALTLWVPATGAVFGLAFAPLLAGAVLAAVGRRFLDGVPLWYVMAVLPLCVLAYLGVGAPWIAAVPLAGRLVIAAVFEAAALLLGWWLDGRHSDRLPAVTWRHPADAGKR